MLRDAVAALDRQSVPLFGSYLTFLSPEAAEEVALDNLTMGASYRVRETAWSIMRHERRRKALGRRGHVTAQECIDRAARLG
jgi:hypothetical protein